MKTKTILEYAYYNDQVSPMGSITLKRLTNLVNQGLLIARPNNKFWITNKGLTFIGLNTNKPQPQKKPR